MWRVRKVKVKGLRGKGDGKRECNNSYRCVEWVRASVKARDTGENINGMGRKCEEEAREEVL